MVLLTLLLRKTPLTAKKVMMGSGSLYAVFVAVAIYQVVIG